MRRSPPPERKTPLRRSKIKQSAPLSKEWPEATKFTGRRTPSIGRPRDRVAGSGKKIPGWVREACVKRSGGRCEAQVAEVCRGSGGHLHHKLMRSQGGKHTQENLIYVCLPCHTHIHAHPTWAYDNGLLVRRAAG